MGAATSPAVRVSSRAASSRAGPGRVEVELQILHVKLHLIDCFLRDAKQSAVKAGVVMQSLRERQKRLAKMERQLIDVLFELDQLGRNLILAPLR